MVSAERIQITLSGGAPWGFRLSGGGALPLTINKIRKKSPAHNQGLKEGDAVISINGVHVHDKTQDEALELVEKAGETLALEIFRGDIDELSREKPKKPIQVPSTGNAEEGVITLSAPIESLSSGAANIEASPELVLKASVDNVTSDSFDTAESELSHGGFKLTATVDDISGTTFSTTETSSGFTVTASVDDMTSSTNAAILESSPMISAQIGDISSSGVDEVHAASTLSAVMAEPFVDSKPKSPSPFNPPRLSPQPPVSPKPKKSVSPQQGYSPKPQTISPQPPPSFSPQPPQSRSPQPPAVSPKPMRIVSPQPPPVSPKPPGATSSVASTTFDDGQTRREVTREHHVQRSDDGSSTTVVQRETTTTSTLGRPSMLKNKASAFNAVEPGFKTQRSSSTTTTTLKSTSNVINQKGPTPFQSSASSNITACPAIQPWPTTSGANLSSGNTPTTAPPIFKPSKFVPGSSKKDIPGLYTPTSPMVDVNVQAMYKDGKENVAPQPMFQVKNIVSSSTKSRGRDVWRPNMWLPGQQPSATYEEPSIATPKEECSPYSSFPVPKIRPGYSLVEEQKRKLLQSQTSRNEYDDYYNEDHQAQHKHGRLHIFAPPVEIHADSGYPESPYSPYDDHYHYHMEEYDEEASSPGSSVTGRRKKNIYSDSAFYDTPGKNYPTITEQMKLCKKIAQSLTSAANRRARGAKMFMKRKRKSSKWVHEGHSEWSSSAGDVANLHELDSELSPDEGGNKPLLYFKIPNLKNRVSSEAKSTKMALTQEQFEKLRLSSKKCDHRALPPDTCFDIVADLKAHKGRGGRLFERRKQRSDKFVVEESKYVPPQRKLENVLSQPVRQEKTPWQAAMEHGGNVDAAFSHLTEWERNQKLNQILKLSPPRKLQTTPLPPNVQAAPLPTVRSSLRSDESPHILKGKNFNRIAKGWAGGGEYPIAENVHHVSPTRQLAPSHSSQAVSQQQNYNNKIKAWQGPGESPYVSVPVQSRQQEYYDARRPDNSWMTRSQGSEWSEPRHESHSNGFYQAPRPKSWQPDSYDGFSYREDIDYTYAPVDYRFGDSDHSKVAYRQPIIPGTDL